MYSNIFGFNQTSSRREKALKKFQELCNEKQRLNHNIAYCDREWHRLVELYMEGQIIGSIGKGQKALEKEKESYIRKVRKVDAELNRLNEIYGFVM